MGVIALDAEGAGFSPVEKSAHDRLVFSWVWRRYPQTSLVIYKHWLLRRRCLGLRLRCSIGLGWLASGLIGERCGSGLLAFGRRGVRVDDQSRVLLACSRIVASTLIVLGCSCFNFANFLHWSISGRSSC